MSFVFSELADCGHSACYAGIRNGTWCFLADWIPSRGIEISCYSFLLLVFFSFPSFMLLLCKLSIEQTTFGQARNVRYRWKTRTGYLQERLRRQFAWGDHPRERRCLLGSNQNICKAWPEAESKKSYQRVGRDFQPLWSRLHFGHRWVIGIYRVE